MFIFIVFAVVTTSMVLIAFIRVTADMDDMQNSSTFSARREYLK
ncbi:MAG: hypothetical protein U1A25_02255 [Candidatus Sungbacteria bacterium]|nr:hypothetical protein [Candidatus Sungbacteria bacterium]